MHKSIERIREFAYRLDDKEDQVLALLDRLDSNTDPSVRMDVYLLSYMCEYCALHSEYRADAERRHQVFNNRYTARKLSHIRESEYNFKLVLQYRIDLVLSCLDNIPHTNRYTGDKHD